MADTLDQQDNAPRKIEGAVSGFRLKNQGGFVARFTVFWNDPDADNDWERWYPRHASDGIIKSGRILILQAKCYPVSYFTGGLEIPKNGQLWMKVFVQWGEDQTSPLRFSYNADTQAKANFQISGTVWNSTLTPLKTYYGDCD